MFHVAYRIGCNFKASDMDNVGGCGRSYPLTRPAIRGCCRVRRYPIEITEISWSLTAHEVVWAGTIHRFLSNWWWECRLQNSWEAYLPRLPVILQDRRCHDIVLYSRVDSRRYGTWSWGLETVSSESLVKSAVLSLHTLISVKSRSRWRSSSVTITCLPA